jgi:hypothetical protein
MSKYILYALLTLIAGCSTGPYLHPQSSAGQNAVLERTCPGPKAAISFAPVSEDLNWVRVLVYVAPPGTSNGPGKPRTLDTELRLFGRLYTPPRLRGQNIALRVTAASPMVTVQLVSGQTYQVSIQQLQTGFDPREDSDPAIKGTALGAGGMDDFTLTFPDIFVNGEKVPMAPIHFKMREERYAPVFNC